MTTAREQIDISWFEFEGRAIAHVRAGRLPDKRMVPPAGEDYAFTIERWKRRVEVSVSPTGRSVRVWVDGTEIK